MKELVSHGVGWRSGFPASECHPQVFVKIATRRVTDFANNIFAFVGAILPVRRPDGETYGKRGG